MTTGLDTSALRDTLRGQVHSYYGALMTDSETLALRAFKDEGTFLNRARLASDALTKRLSSAHPNVGAFTLSRDELTELSTTLARAVSIGCEYHLDAAELPIA